MDLEQKDDSALSEVTEIIVPDEKSENERISELSKRGYQLLKQDDTDGAIASFNAILEIENNNNYALVGLGDTERKMNHIDLAISYYEKCLSFYPSNSYALFGLADCYKIQNQYQKAIKIWEQYLVHDDKNITVITRVADAYRKIHVFKKSKELYLKVLEMDPKNAYALIGLGHLNYDFKEYKEALNYWTKMYEMDDQNVDIRVLTAIGNCHRKLKTFESGTIYFKKALERSPNNFYALFGLADCFRGMNKQDESVIYWNKILEIDPSNKVILTRAGDAYRTSGDYDTAIKYYNKALDIDFDIYAAIGLALICKCQGKLEEASERFENLINNDPKNYRLYVDLAECYIAMNKRDEAIKLLENFLKFETKNQAVTELLEKIQKNII